MSCHADVAALSSLSPDIFAGGDVAEYPYLEPGKAQRVERWDHAIQHGKCAGVDMAGADPPSEGTGR